jgi:hypothetical protein
VALSLPRVWKRVVLLLGSAALIACIVVASCEPLVVDNAEHEPSLEEDRLIQSALQAARAVIERESQPDRLYKRDAHAPPHGCVQALFSVRPDIAAGFRQGVLEVPGKQYEAWVRFSNGIRSDDTLPDARGMAIKLMGVKGQKLLPSESGEETQDFVMINHHTFFADDVAEYLDFFAHQSRGDDFGYFIGLNPLRWHLRELGIGLQLLLQHVESPLEATYYSMLPFKLGPDQNIKFSAKPCDPAIPERCEPPEVEAVVERGPHYLRAALVKALRYDPGGNARRAGTAAARFSFGVQVQRPGFRMPIEHASMRWSEAASPFVPVAELTIPYQRFDSEEQNRFCENLSFNPWHALPAHAPIGGLNRSRRVVYEAISSYRHAHNGVEQHEPRGLCLRLDGQPCASNIGVAERGDVPR